MYKFNLGERKIVGIKVYSNDGRAFTISEANYQLINNESKMVEISGSATINSSSITAVIEPLHIGNYTLKLEFIIPPEKLIEEIMIKVE